ncbi:unnamed protein product, partial [Brassica napus]
RRITSASTITGEPPTGTPKPPRSTSTPHHLHRDRLSSQLSLISERINRGRDLIRHSSIQGQKVGGFAQTNDLPPESIHRPPTRAQPTKPEPTTHN